MLRFLLLFASTALGVFTNLTQVPDYSLEECKLISNTNAGCFVKQCSNHFYISQTFDFTLSKKHIKRANTDVHILNAKTCYVRAQQANEFWYVYNPNGDEVYIETQAELVTKNAENYVLQYT
jgi:tRNA(Leu) C34 or U34 (ribose-2'-O)-methylase TrmL